MLSTLVLVIIDKMKRYSQWSFQRWYQDNIFTKQNIVKLMKCVTLGHTHKTSRGCGVLLNGEIKNVAEQKFFGITLGKIHVENTT